jgi:glycerate dehydrogenase
VKIVVVDNVGFPQDLISRLESTGNELVIWDDVPETGTAIQRLQGAEVAVMGWTTLPRSALEQLNLRYISLALTGTEIVDLEACRDLGIVVSNVPKYSTQSVAEYAFALLLCAIRHIREADAQVRLGNSVSPNEELRGFELCGKTLGILGLGSIGQWIAGIAAGFGMRMIASSRTPKNLDAIEDVDIDVLLRQSDVLMVAIETNSETAGMLDRRRIQMLKRGSVLINVTSNQVLDEEALYERLACREIRAAAFDDVSHSGHDEQTAADSRLLELPNVVLSPQAGWYTVEAERRLLEIACDNIFGYLEGAPTNVVSADIK